MTLPGIDGPRDVGLTVRDLVLEVRTSVQLLRDDLIIFKPTVVTKAELDLFKLSQQSSRRWAMGIITTMIGVGVGCITFVVNHFPLAP